jgi:uncharacterized protein (TIGR02145 family)
VLSGIFANIDWGDASHFIKLEADFSGGSNYDVLGTQELMSVPYALYATKTDTSELNLTSRLATKLTKTDTASLSNRIDFKLTKTDPGQNGQALILVNGIPSWSTLSTSVTDIDGNIYGTVQIGNQVWMSENLKTSRYRNGDLIPIVTDNTAWGALTNGSRSLYSNDSTTYENPYGNLYNWYAVTDNRGLCPNGWHAPTDAEWTILTTYLGGESVAGGKMKSIGTWNAPNTGATNESGFSVLPGGFRSNDGSIYNIRGLAFFWSAPEYDITFAWLRYLNYDIGYVGRDSYVKSVGASVRCLRD